jgi:hypothetical protein
MFDVTLLKIYIYKKNVTHHCYYLSGYDIVRTDKPSNFAVAAWAKENFQN